MLFTFFLTVREAGVKTSLSEFLMLLEALSKHVQARQSDGKRVAIALWSEGARERMSHVLADHKLVNLVNVGAWRDVLAMPKHAIALGRMLA